MKSSRRLTALSIAFLFSGALGLVYESLWPHYLKLFLGHASYAQTLVLVVFIGGLALGAAACARYSQRLRNPLRLYALVEAIIGLVALAFHEVFVRATDWAYATLLPATCNAHGLCLSQWLLAALLILPQSTLLGATFPLMTAGVLRLSPDDHGRKLALFYAHNTLGGVAGVLLSTFLLVAWVGLPGSLLASGIGNILLGIAVYEISKDCERPARGEDRAAQAQAGPVKGSSLLLLVAALTGFSSFFYEVIWIRMLSLVLGASTHAFELMLASFLLGLALGGYWIRRRIDRSVAPTLILAKVQLVMGALAILTLPVYNRTFGVMAWLYAVLAKTDGGYVLYNFGSAAISLLVMLPATCAAGMTLPLITILLMRKGANERAIGQVYAVNTLGAIAGVACVVHVALPALGLKFSLLFAGAVDIGLGLLLLHQGGWFRLVASWQMVWPAGALGVLLLSSFAFGLDVRQTASGVYRYGSARLPEDREILFHKDGKTATVDVLRTPRGRVAILTNGKSEASVQPRIDETPPTLDTSTMVMTGLAGPLHAPEAHEAAVIGFGSGISTTTLLAFPGIRRVDTVEIEPAMVEGARHFEPLVTPAYRDPRSHIIIDDAKSTFARSGHRYDVIVSEPSNPWVSGVSSLFTTEFYQRVKQHLRAGAVLVQWIQLYEITPALVATILKTLSGQFDDYVIYESAANDIVIVASPRGRLAGLRPELLRAPEVQRLATWARLGTPPDWSASRVGGRNLIQPYIDGWGEVTNSDYFPLVDLQAPRARFTQATAKEITELRFSPLPLGAFLGEPEPAGQPPTDGRPLPLGQNQVKAAVAGEVFRHLTETKPSRHSDALLGSSLYWQFRWWHDTAATCQSSISPGQMLDATLQIFGEILPHLRSSEIGHLVAVARTHACIQPHGETFRPWLAMIEAIGTRNFAAVAAAARDISSWPGQRRSALQDECLSLAAMGALVALGQSAQAVPARGEGESPFARWQSTAWFRVLDRMLGRPLTSAQ